MFKELEFDNRIGKDILVKEQKQRFRYHAWFNFSIRYVIYAKFVWRET